MTDKTPTIRVRPVAGRMVRDAVSREVIDAERDVPDTRAIRRAIAAGDLELVGGDRDDDKPDDVQQQPDANPAWGIEPRTDHHADTALTEDERRAAREADVRTLEKEKF